MKRGKRLLIMAVCLLLVHTSIEATLDLRTSLLNPITKVSPTETDQSIIFLKEFNILALALAMYYLEAEERPSKDEMKERFAEDLNRWEEKFNVIFDLDNIRKHGFTRYYPFTVNGKSFMIRLFDTDERRYLPKVAVLCEGKFKEDIGFQILPGLEEILKDNKVKQLRFLDPAVYTRHP